MDSVAVRRVVRADGNHHELISTHRFHNPSRDDADTKLTRLVAFDDRNIRVTDVLLDASTQLLAITARSLNQLENRSGSDARR